MRQAQRVIHREQKLVGRNRLFQKIDGAQFRGAHRHFNRSLPGHHHGGTRHARFLEVFEQRDAVSSRHHHVGKNQIEALRLREFERARGVVANGGLVARQAKRSRKRRQGVGVVVDDQDVRFRRHLGLRPSRSPVIADIRSRIRWRIDIDVPSITIARLTAGPIGRCTAAYRQRDMKRRADARFALDGDASAVVAHHRLHDGQPRPVPCCFVV